MDVLPGATAFVPAVLLSGLVPQPFSFIGFLPDARGEHVAALEKLKAHPFTMVFYLSPHKAAKQTEDLLSVLGDRPCALVREISKVYQETRRGTLSSVLAGLEDGIKGELALVVAPAPADEKAGDDAWQSEALQLREAGEPIKKIAEELAAEYAVPKNRIKAWLLEQK